MVLRDVSKSSMPLFVDPSTLSYEEGHDPDYALKVLERDFNKGRYNIGIGCSKCHHCR
jgi:hypothetical protein